MLKKFTIKVSRLNTSKTISGLINTVGTLIEWLLNNAVCKTEYRDCFLWKKKWWKRIQGLLYMTRMYIGGAMVKFHVFLTSTSETTSLSSTVSFHMTIWITQGKKAMLSLLLRVHIFNYNAKYHLIPQATQKHAVTFHNTNRSDICVS
jgi:hypothetical protein